MIVLLILENFNVEKPYNLYVKAEYYIQYPLQIVHILMLRVIVPNINCGTFFSRVTMHEMHAKNYIINNKVTIKNTFSRNFNEKLGLNINI